MRDLKISFRFVAIYRSESELLRRSFSLSYQPVAGIIFPSDILCAMIYK